MAPELGVTGMPNASESIMVERDIALSELTGAPMHIAHVSTRESVRATPGGQGPGGGGHGRNRAALFPADRRSRAAARRRRQNEPAAALGDGPRGGGQGLADGTIDCIATDHAPHAPAEKTAGLAQAPNGIIGLETALASSLAWSPTAPCRCRG